MMKIIITMVSALTAVSLADCNGAYWTSGDYAYMPWDVCAQTGNISEKLVCGDDDAGYYVKYSTTDCSGDSTNFSIAAAGQTAKCSESTNCSYTLWSGYVKADGTGCGSEDDGDDYHELVYVSECSEGSGSSYQYTCNENGIAVLREWTNDDCSGTADSETTLNACLTSDDCPATLDPTTEPTWDPTVDPTTDPTWDPTVDPTTDPTWDPTTDPTWDPTVDPTTDSTAGTINGEYCEHVVVVNDTVCNSGAPDYDSEGDECGDNDEGYCSYTIGFDACAFCGTASPTTVPTIVPTTEPTLEPTSSVTAESETDGALQMTMKTVFLMVMVSFLC